MQRRCEHDSLMHHPFTIQEKARYYPLYDGLSTGEMHSLHNGLRHG
jgi:hypothetical protein